MNIISFIVQSKTIMYQSIIALNLYINDTKFGEMSSLACQTSKSKTKIVSHTAYTLLYVEMFPFQVKKHRQDYYPPGKRSHDESWKISKLLTGDTSSFMAGFESSC